jgi:hypothetical protein
MNEIIEVEDAFADIKTKALTYPQQAETIKILDGPTLAKANDFLLGIKRLQKQIKDTFEPLIRKAHEAHRALLEQEKKYTQPLIQAEAIIKNEIRVYLAEQDRIRREEEERIRKEKEEAERKRKEEEEKILAEAIALEKAGKLAEADRVISQEPKTPEVIEKPPEKIRLPGTFMRSMPHWRVKNLSLVPQEYLITLVNERKIDEVFGIMREKTEIPGIEIYFEDQVVSGRER